MAESIVNSLKFTGGGYFKIPGEQLGNRKERRWVLGDREDDCSSFGFPEAEKHEEKLSFSNWRYPFLPSLLLLLLLSFDTKY